VKGRELGRHGLADDDRARRPRQRDARGISRGAMVGVDRRTVARRQVARVEQILDGDWESVQQSRRRLRIECACTAQRSVGIQDGPSPHRGFALGDSLEAVLEQGYRGNLSRRQLAHRGSRAQAVEAAHVKGSARAAN
jgi:hypothetical protein